MTTPPATEGTVITSPAVMLHDDEARELAWLLGQVEDWLLHTDQYVTDDLDYFLGPPLLGHTRADDVVERLGHYSIVLGRRDNQHRGAPA